MSLEPAKTRRCLIPNIVMLVRLLKDSSLDILNDPDQKLFTSCAYVSPSAVRCNYPIIVGQQPPYCSCHIDLVSGARESKPQRKRKAPDEEKETKRKPKENAEKSKPETPRPKKKVIHSASIAAASSS